MKTYAFNRMLSLVVTLTLFGCSGLPSIAMSSTPTATSTKIFTSTPVIKTPVGTHPIPTTEQSSEGSFPHPIPATEESSEEILENCLEMFPFEAPPPVETANHLLLLQEDSEPRSLFLDNLGNGIKTQITSSNSYEVFISPNHTQFGYVQLKKPTREEFLTIHDSKGEIIKIMPLPLASFFWGWLDKDQIMITIKKDADSTDPYALFVFNLLGGTSKELSDQESYKDLEDVSYLPWQYNRVIYDPTLNFAVYPSHHGEAATLYNVSSQEVLSVLRTITAYIASPAWSPDGNFVVLAGAPVQKDEETVLYRDTNELFLLDKLGNVTQLTHFSKQYGRGEVGEVSWSPDGKHLAMWVSVGSDTDERLMVLDLDSRQVTNYCVTGMKFEGGFSKQPKPFWSPDSRIILINNRDSVDSPTNIIWIDIQNNWLGMYPTNAHLWGWLTTPESR